MKLKVNLKNVLANTKSKMIKKVIEEETDGYELSTLMEMITLCEETNAYLAYEVMKAILDEDPHDAILMRFADFLKQHPHILSEMHDLKSNIEKMNEFIQSIIENSAAFTQNTLIEFAAALEELFAYGYYELGLKIYHLYRIIQTSSSAVCNEALAIQKELVSVYQYNQRNYISLLQMLEQRKDYCKAAKLKHLTRMVNYYFAVLGVLSGQHSCEYYLNKACEKRFPLAFILRDSAKINSETPKR